MNYSLDFFKGLRNPWENSFLDDFIKGPNSYFAPSCDVSEDKEKYYFKMDLPGVEKENVKIEIEDNILSVSGERKGEKKEESKSHFVREIVYGSFVRRFAIPANVDSDKIEAKYENGVLSVVLAKSEAAKPKSIQIN